MQFLSGLFPSVHMKKTTTQNLVTFKEFLADLGSDWGPWRDRWVMYDPKGLTGQDKSRGCDVCNF